MKFTWLKRLIQGLPPTKSFPQEWETYLQNNVGAYKLLAEDEKSKLLADVPVLIERKYWEGCGGLILTDEIKVTIAGQACLLLSGIEHDYFSNVRSILVYPTAYRGHYRWVDSNGVVHEGTRVSAGEAWSRGTVILGWDEVLKGGMKYRDGRNVVLHEFAHQLDFMDGWHDGTPLLKNQEQYQQWRDVMTEEFNRLIEESEQGSGTLLDKYGTTNPAEFFAVATECFFEQPVQMKMRHERLYDLLREYYGQDTAQRFSHTR